MTVSNLFKFSAQDRDLEYFSEPHNFFWHKATFNVLAIDLQLIFEAFAFPTALRVICIKAIV